MTLQLLPMEEEDLPVFTKIVSTAFQGELMRALYPQGFGEVQQQQFTNKLSKKYQAGSTTRFNKIIDTSLPEDSNNQIISVAEWTFHTTLRSEAELDAEDKKDPSTASGVNYELKDAFHGEMHRNRRRVWGGRPYILLNLLATVPDHHRRGSGARQLEWGLAAADELNLPVWLEASKSGKPLYERYGFIAIDNVDFDAPRWGLAADFVNVNMLRPALKPSTDNPIADLSTILVLGAGELGLQVLKALASHASVKNTKTKVAVLLQPGSKSIETVKQISPSFAILTEDIAAVSMEALADHFKLFDGIICCTGFAGGLGTQRKITGAVSQAGQSVSSRKRYIPWQFGVDYDAFGRGGRMELWDEQLDVRDQLRSSSWPKNVDWTIVSTGIFTSFLFEEAFGVVTGLKSGSGPVTVQALGGSGNKVTATSANDIGRLTVDVLFDTTTLNQVVYTAGQTISYAQLAREVEIFVQGKKQVRLEEKSVPALLAELGQDSENAYKKYRVVFAEGRGVSWSPAKAYNVQNGIVAESVKGWLTSRTNLSSH